MKKSLEGLNSVSDAGMPEWPNGIEACQKPSKLRYQ